MSNKHELRGRKLELYINLKYPEWKVQRPIRFWDETYKIDPKTFILSDDNVLKDIVKANRLKASLNHDKTVANCMNWIKDNIEYTRDRIDWKVTNNWKLPSITAQSKIGDCEDTSLLLVSLAINAWVPYYRLKVVSWTVQFSETAPTGWHAWVLYCREEDNEWEVWESTSKWTANKWLAKDLIWWDKYKKIYWTCNEKKIFSQKEIKSSDWGEFI